MNDSDIAGLLIATLGGAAVGLERQWSGHADGPAARFAGIRTFTMLGAMGGLSGWLWTAGVFTSAAVLGLTDVDALTVSMAREIAPTLSPAIAAAAIAVGVLANTAMKLGLAVALGAPTFRAIAGGALALMLVAIGATLLILPR